MHTQIQSWLMKPLIILLTVLLVACGGGSDGPTITGTGKFIDGPVKGLHYRTGSMRGVTNSDGEFSYKKGETITFSYANVDLGSAVAADIMTPWDLVKQDDLDIAELALINMLRLFQSLDSNEDHSDGIQLYDLSDILLNVPTINFNQGITAFEQDYDLSLYLTNIAYSIIGVDVITLINAQEAVDHFLATIEAENNKIPGSIVIPVELAPDTDGDGIADTLDNCTEISNSNQENADGDSAGDACDAFPNDPTEIVDTEGDGVGNNSDNCPSVANPNQENNDDDAMGNACDTDDDNDDIVDTVDNCPLVANTNQTNSDDDSMGDACDTDNDNDGVLDTSDNCPIAANPNQENNDDDAMGNACDTDDDNDDIVDTADNCPLVANTNQTNSDDDTMGDACDTDNDNDGVLDTSDNCPIAANPNQENDDDDVFGNACDTDDDNDGVLDDAPDNCRVIPNADQENLDGDDKGDACDNDMDGDGVNNGSDNCPLIDNPGQENSDDDLNGNACDSDDDNDGLTDEEEASLGTNPILADTDSDGANDQLDNCPLISNSDQLNSDNDPAGNACDSDDDNDGLTDDEEASLGTNPILADTDSDGTNDQADNCPIDSNPDQLDTDNDKQGNVCDEDDDGDGLTDLEESSLGTDPLQPDTDTDGFDDSSDNCPVDSNSLQTDSDGDGVGDACDSDIDGDSVNNDDDNCPLVENLSQTNTDGDNLGDACDSDADVPHPASDSITLMVNSTNNLIDVLVNDNFGVDGQGNVALEIVVSPVNGTAVVDDNSTPSDPSDDVILYSPNTDFAGSDALTYQITDTSGSTSIAVVNITVEMQFTNFTASNTSNPKEIAFNWAGAGLGFADHFTLFVNSDGASGYTVVPEAESIPNTETGFNLIVSVHLTDWMNAKYLIEAQDSGDSLLASRELYIDDQLSSENHIGIIKASNTYAGDLFGYGTALSGDGSTLAISALREDSANQSELDTTTVLDSGAVYVYIKQNQSWTKQAFLKSPSPGIEDRFGRSIALSNDGNILVVGADQEDSNSTGVNRDAVNNDANNSGAAYIYVRENGTWTQPFYLKAHNTGQGDLFGFDVDISSDGNTIVIGAKAEDGASTGVNGTDNIANTVINSGAAYVFTKELETWTQLAYLKADSTSDGDFFGNTVATCSDGSVIAVTSISEDSGAVGINGIDNNDDLSNSGAVYLFEKNGDSWSQVAFVKASNPMENAIFGNSLDLSDDCSTLVVGAHGDKSASTAVDGSQLDDGLNYAGAAYVFKRGDISWQQQAYIKPSNTAQADLFGTGVAISSDGNLMAVSASQESSDAIGINGDETDNSNSKSGAVYVFVHSQEEWRQVSYVKAANNTGSTINFGGTQTSSIGWYPSISNLSMDSSGETMAVGAAYEDSEGTGVNGALTVNGAVNSGAVYLY